MMSEQQTFVIVGAGLAGAKAAEALRTEGFDGKVVLIGNEAERPYDRPPLSKDYLLGRSEKNKIFVHPKEWYAEHQVDLRLDTRVSSIDRAAHQVVTDDGERIGYDKCLLATGSSPRRLSVPGADLHGVHYLRSVEDCEAIKVAFAMLPELRPCSSSVIEDCEAIKGALTTPKAVAIIGAGWIGLETAVAARAAGCEVTVLEMAELPLVRVLGPEVAQVYADLHRAQGVQLRLGVRVSELTGKDGMVTGVRLDDGCVIDADMVVVGVGITPNTQLAQAAGLSVDNGVVVDEYLATTDADVFAAGDVANCYYPQFGTHLRLEHWSAALNQGPVAASNMMGNSVEYDQVPYFFSDQYDMGMEYTGFVAGGTYDGVIFRGDVAKGEFIAFWVRDNRVLAGMNVNIWDVTDAIAALVRSGEPVDPAKLADPEVPLSDLGQ